MRRFLLCTMAAFILAPLEFLATDFTILNADTIALGARANAHEGHHEQPVDFETEAASLSGTVLLPHEPKIFSGEAEARTSVCVVIVGGTLSHTRDGEMVGRDAPPRDALRRLAVALADRGYASVRYDKPGFGQSKKLSSWRGSYAQEAEVAAAAIHWARAQDQFSQVIVAAESAGAYLACLAARAGSQADAYIFLGAHCGPGEEIYEYNFGRLADYYAQAGAEDRDWIEHHLRIELALGRTYPQMFQAAAKGKETFEIVDGDFRKTIDSARRKEELALPPDKMFEHISVPALCLAGEHDLNVRPTHAARAVEIMRAKGNHGATCALIPGADHSFQRTPDDPDERFRERHFLTSFRRPYEPRMYAAVANWLDENVPRLKPAGQGSDNDDSHARGASGPDRSQTPLFSLSADHPVAQPRSDTTPRREFFAPGIVVVDDIAAGETTAGVETLEGKIGPLILADDSQAHFIDMPAGMYCPEHPHSRGSIIYTVRGKWVLASQGRRRVMHPGSLFHFADDVPTGYEVPFDEPAYILIFKGERLSKSEREFIDYLQSLKVRLEKEHNAGVAYLLTDLPADHPARKYAEQLKSAENDARE